MGKHADKCIGPGARQLLLVLSLYLPACHACVSTESSSSGEPLHEQRPTFFHRTKGYGGHSQYLTLWGLALSALTCALGLLEDLSLATASMKMLHINISLVVGGLETLLTLVYWSTLWYDETLILRQRRLPGKALGEQAHQPKAKTDRIFQMCQSISTPSFF